MGRDTQAFLIEELGVIGAQMQFISKLRRLDALKNLRVWDYVRYAESDVVTLRIRASVEGPTVDGKDLGEYLKEGLEAEPRIPFSYHPVIMPLTYTLSDKVDEPPEIDLELHGPESSYMKE